MLVPCFTILPERRCSVQPQWRSSCDSAVEYLVSSVPFYSQAKTYGTCVASKLPEVEKGQCEKEFGALKACMQRAVGVAAQVTHVDLIRLVTLHGATSFSMVVGIGNSYDC